MTQLYPIGTQLITRRLSQAALYMEIFGEKDILFYKDPGYTPDEDEEYKFWMPFFVGDYLDKARVTVTAENQKWLSPVPMVGDLVIFHGESNRVPYPQFWKEHNIYDGTQTVEKRTYPNNQRAPMIEWYEVIEPEMEGRK